MWRGTKLDVEIWDGGLHEHEVTAINKIKEAFTEKSSFQAKSNAKNGASLGAQLQNLGISNGSGMFPWKGYAGFRFVDGKREGEFDLVIVTHCNIIIVELKDWNHQKITARNETWYQGERNMGRSPVSITRQKKFMLEKKLDRLRQRFSNKGYTPRVYFFVVMTGNSDFSQLPEVDLQHTISLQDFLKFSDQRNFNDYFRPHPNEQKLKQDHYIFDELFLGKQTAAKALRIHGYEATEEIFQHPEKIYKEYIAKPESNTSGNALLRLWNFKKLSGDKAATVSGRAEILSREREVLQSINLQNRDLYNHCLRSLTSLQQDEVTTEYVELYELPPGHVRFNEFIGKYGVSFSDIDRLNVAKLLLAKFADLHDIKVAHRDIADHSLWISPAKEIALSSFISAYHQPLGTVGDYRRSLSVGPVTAHEMLDRERLTAFQQDVHTLGLVVWHLLNGTRISPKSLNSIQNDMQADKNWYSKVLLNAVAADFESAVQFFDALKKAEPTAEVIPTFEDTELEPYRHPINHLRQYREDGSFIVETDEKEVYVSDGRLVKAWLNAGSSGDDPVKNFQVAKFLKQIDRLSSVSPIYLPKILDYGIASKSSSLYLVTEQVQGETWDRVEIPENEKVEFILKLVSAIEHLHGLSVAHGDLHPGNLMVDMAGRAVYLIDIPDFTADQEEPKNHAYSPEYIDNCTAFERDNFAVMKIACELLGIPWGHSSDNYPYIAEAVCVELKDPEFGFKGLARFKKSLENKKVSREQRIIEVYVRDVDEAVTILPDNGRLYVKIEKSTKGPKEARVSFYGIGGRFRAIFNNEEKSFMFAFPPSIRSSVRKQDIDECQFEIESAIKINPGRTHDLTELSALLKNDEDFVRSIDLALEPEKEQEELDPLTLQLKEAFAKLEQQKEKHIGPKALGIPTVKLWRAVLDTETESHPNIEINGEIEWIENSHNEISIPYSNDIDPLGGFNSADEVEAFQVDKSGVERPVGDVLLKKSALNEIRIKNIRPRTINRLNEGEIIFFRSKQDRASYLKRKRALERLLDREGAIPDLIDLFDPSCNQEPKQYGISVSDEDFERYDREDAHGNKISLNEQQREAFSKLVNNGPLSLLQGPPGTGKTEFIAAFVHYLVEKQSAQRILLVSQSHEAVNTAAERIRRHCARLNTTLEVVRFSNREGAVSAGLKDVYSNAITTEKRELFNAEIKYRVESLGEAFGLESEFISGVVQAELKLFNRIDRLEQLLNDLESPNAAERYSDQEIKQLKNVAINLDRDIRDALLVDYGINLSAESKINDAKNNLISNLCAEYGVRPDEERRVRALAKISRDMQDALSGERVNLDEFYARSRQLVAGTCVGIGQGHIGIQDNVYDWVIIDEAARSIASELAIAMQSAKRVLLVGDHLQLPPLYSDEHKKALARKLGLTSSNAEMDELLRSDFERAFNSLYGQQASAALLTQYRMAPAIGDLVSHTFYNGKLKNGNRVIPEIYKNGPQVVQATTTWLDTSGLGQKSYHSSDRGASIYNRCEADQIISILKQISDCSDFVAELSDLVTKDEAAIGVICMYAEQKRLIRQKFNQEVWADGFKELVKIDTVDSYQGKENRVIIVSITRADKHHTTGFLRTPNRINVAMSRAMDRLLIVGNADIWKGKNKDFSLGRVIDYMEEHANDDSYKFIVAK